MRAVIQRVIKGRVTVEEEVTGEIRYGLVVLLGVGNSDLESDADYLAEKIANLRIFEDEQGKLNRSVIDISGKILAVSQFTLYGDVRKGRRPSFSDAAPPEEAKRLYEYFVKSLQKMNIAVETGIFQANMLVEIYNDGPVTILLDSGKCF